MEKKITIYPAHEFVLEQNIDSVIKSIKNRFDGEFEENIKQDIEQINNGNYISKIDKYLDSFYTKSASLLEYLPEDSIIFLDEITKIKARAKNILIDNENVQKMLVEKEKNVPDAILKMIDSEVILDKIAKKKNVYLEKQDIGILDEKTACAKRNEIRFSTREINYYKSSMELFLEDIQNAINEEKTVIVLGGNEETSRKLSLLLLEKDIPHKYLENLNSDLPKNVVIVTQGSLETGFEEHDIKLMVISSKELLTSDKKKKEGHTVLFPKEKKLYLQI